MNSPLPNDLEAERCLLGSILLDDRAYTAIDNRVRPASFYLQRHAIIYTAITQLAAIGRPIDAVTLRHQLEKASLLADAGGPEYLLELGGAVPTSSNVAYYAEIVREKALARDYIHAAHDVIQLAMSPNATKNDLDNMAQAELFKIAHQTADDAHTLASILHPTLSRIASCADELPQDPRLNTGYEALDDLLSGFQPGQLILAAGRPSMGKSSLALNIAENVAILGNRPCAVFSLEMNSRMVARNILCSRARINQHRLKQGKLSLDEKARLVGAATQLSASPMQIDDTPGLSVSQIRSRARKMHAKEPLSLIIIDYLQLVAARPADAGGSRFDSRQDAIGFVSRSMKELARELDVPVLALSQLNRDVEKRDNHRPMLSDLRESGSLEQDADVVILIHRPSYFQQAADADAASPTDALLIVAKQRTGPTGDIRLLWREQFTRFDQPVPYQKEPSDGR